MPSNPQPAKAPEGVTFGDPVPAGVTFGQPAKAPEGVTFGDAAPPPAKPEDHPLWQRAIGFVNDLGTIPMTRGFMKSLEAGAGGTLDTAGKVLTGGDVKEQPGTFNAGGGALGMPSIPVPEGARKAVQAVVNPTAEWLKKNTDLNGFWENMGGAGELVWELINGNAETRGVGKAVGMADKLGEGQKTFSVLEGKGVGSQLARIGLKALTHAVKAGGEMGAQTLLHSEDPDKAVSATGQGAAVGGLLGAGTSAYSEVKNALAPTIESMEGHDMPVMANQKPNAPAIAKVLKTAEDIPKFDEAQQAVPDKVIRTGAQRATKRVLDQVNEGRQFQGPTDAAGNPPGSFKFSVDKYDPRIAETPAEATATDTQAQIGSQASAVPERLGGGTPTAATVRRQQLGSMASTVPDDIIRGKVSPIAEKIETTDPNEAVKLLTDARQLQRVPNLPARLQARVDARVAELEQQLTDYHDARAASPNFKPIDVEKAINDTHDYETAGELMQNSVRDVYTRMNEATGGRMGELIQQPRAKAIGEMNELFEKHKDQFTKQEWEAASNAYRQGFVAKDLHNIINDGFNRSVEDAATTGEGRRWSGSQQMTKRLDKLMHDHGDDVENMIGEEGIANLRRMKSILGSPESATRFQELVHTIARVARRHSGSVGGMLGGTVAQLTGTSHYHGAMAGVIAASAVQKVLNRMATNPVLMERAAYAIENKVPQNIAAPLIYSMIVRGEGLDTPQKKEETTK